MVELTAKTACEGLLPISRGGVTLSEIAPGHITALLPLRGQRAALSAALQAAHGVSFPEVGKADEGEGVSCIWSGRDQAFLIGPAPDPGLAELAAMTDQSDAWATVLLAGEAAEDVLARLVPIDLRPAAFPVGTSARTLCQHMTITIWRREDGFGIMAFRSMARTLAHEIGEAMASVAARQAAG
ncbi:sarcosine oxidase subunit gamma [Antarctobacter jejuensis]|uniref:sarcosine oxidase subunit gamma n=1 Tax=Antarctobacter jejuensis TaxID=1439938 RepID=UPI003FD04BDA